VHHVAELVRIGSHSLHLLSDRADLVQAAGRLGREPPSLDRRLQLERAPEQPARGGERVAARRLRPRALERRSG
jgi:hypothetical protein